MAPQRPAYDIDWVWTNHSNVHVATHRAWFTTFHNWGSHTARGTAVQGIGDVELTVRTSTKREGRKWERKLVLHDVLFMPGIFANIIGTPILNDFYVDMDKNGRTGVFIDKGSNQFVARIDHAAFPKLLLAGQKAGTTSLEPHRRPINLQWPDDQRARWENRKIVLEAYRSRPAPPFYGQPSAPYTSEEKAWLKLCYDGEFYFLRMHCLSIYKEEDREEGRLTARALIEADEQDDSPNV